MNVRSIIVLTARFWEVNNYGMNVRSGMGGSGRRTVGKGFKQRARTSGSRSDAAAGTKQQSVARGEGAVAAKTAPSGSPRAAASEQGAVQRRGRPLVDDKRRRILDAALQTFAERGYHGTSVPEVAEAAKIGVGTLYRYFENKDALVNEVYRDAKMRLRDALLVEPTGGTQGYTLDQGHAWFRALWQRLAAFARAEPETFRFLEMQDHAPYLDPQSRALELSVLAPLWITGKRLRSMWGGPPVDLLIAMMWGAFVGLVKAERLGYLTLDDRVFDEAGEAAWQMIGRAESRTGPSHR